MDLARRSGLAAMALTDHDTLAGIEPARRAASLGLEVIAGVEITTQWQGRELHLLGYFVDPGDGPLNEELHNIRQSRRERFHEMRERLLGMGIHLPAEIPASHSLGRRHLAAMLVAAKKADSIRQAFHRFLGNGGRIAAPKRCPGVEQAIRLVRGAGGVAALAHPSQDDGRALLGRLRECGLQAVEVNFPSCRPGRGQELRSAALALGLAVTGGSDCHGPDRPASALGAHTISARELSALRALATI